MFRIQTRSERITQAERGSGYSRITRESSGNNCKDRCARLPQKSKTQRTQRNNCYVNCKKTKNTPVWNSPRRGSSPKRGRSPKRSPSSRGISRDDCKSRCRNLPTDNKSQRRQQNNCYVNCKN